MQEHKPNSTQQTKILEALEKSNGEWINGRFFNDTLHITQFHSRIHELQKKGYPIEASTFKDDYGFKSYKLITDQTTCCISKKIFGICDKVCSNKTQKIAPALW